MRHRLQQKCVGTIPFTWSIQSTDCAFSLIAQEYYALSTISHTLTYYIDKILSPTPGKIRRTMNGLQYLPSSNSRKKNIYFYYKVIRGQKIVLKF